MKKLLQYNATDSSISVQGTNQFGDFFISLLCIPYKGFHMGCYLSAKKIMKDVQFNAVTIKLSRHSLGGGICQPLAYLLKEKGFKVNLTTQGAYPAMLKKWTCPGIARVYGNDPVPALFPWFNMPVPISYEGPPRKWCKLLWIPNWKDHIRY